MSRTVLGTLHYPQHAHQCGYPLSLGTHVPGRAHPGVSRASLRRSSRSATTSRAAAPGMRTWACTWSTETRWQRRLPAPSSRVCSRAARAGSRPRWKRRSSQTMFPCRCTAMRSTSSAGASPCGRGTSSFRRRALRLGTLRHSDMSARWRRRPRSRLFRAGSAHHL